MKKLRLFLAILLAIVSASSMKATTYGPLLTAKWGTEAPFNGQCKFEYSGTTYQCQPGPTAIAASMVLYYWKYPTTTVGALDAYIGGLTTGSQTVLYSYPALPAKEFDWDSMKDEYTSYTEAAGVAVAELVRYAGRAQQMNYGVSGSSAKADNVVDMLKKFGYDSGTRLVNKSEYSESAWADLIQGEIKAGRPVVYMAANSSGSSHCFCIDGYNSSDDTYHVNFGWGETYNGWHEMNSFKYDSDDFLFNQNQMAVIGIQPARQPYAVVSDDGLTLTFYYDANKPTGDNVLDLPFTAGHYPATNNKNITTATFDPSFADCHDLTTTNAMFLMCDKLQTINNLEYLNTENVTDMAGMFYGCSSLESLDLSHFDTKNVTGNGMVIMFYNCSSLKSLDVSSFEISDGLTDMKQMFADCTSLETIYCAEGADWSTSGDKFDMFYGCTSLSGKYGSKEFKFDKNKIDVTYAKAYMGDDDEGGYFTVREPYAVLSEDGKTLTFYYDAKKAQWQTEVDEGTVYDIPWGSVPGWRTNSTITTVTFDESFKDYNGLKNTSYMFYYLTKLETINNLENLNTEHVTDMSYMFFCCSSLKSLDLGDNFDTSSVKDMTNMFYRCSSLKSLDLGDKFNTSNVTNMYLMFYMCEELKTLDLGDKFDTSKVTNMQNMFAITSLESLDLGDKFNTSNVTNMSMMFYKCTKLTSLDVSSFDIAKVTDMSSMFNNCSNLETIYCAEGTDWSGVSNTSNMFSGCTSLSGKYGSKEFPFNSDEIGGTYAKVYDGTNGGYFTSIKEKPEPYAVISSDGKTLTFRYDAEKPAGAYDIPWGTGDNDYPGWTSSSGNYSVTTVVFDSSFGDYHGLTSCRRMFDRMFNVTAFEGLEYLNTENVIDMSYMFDDCFDLVSLDLSSLDTKNVTNMSHMFTCNDLTSLTLGGKFNTSNVTDMSGMFQSVYVLTSIDFSNFDTQNVTNMSYMFDYCNGLTSLDLSSLDTKNVTNMSHMFHECHNLSSINLGGKFNTSNVTDMSGMFYNNNNLTSLDLSSLDTKKATNMSHMFYECDKLESINLGGNFNTASVTDMSYMFFGCSTLENIILGSTFITSKVQDMSFMFNTCRALETLDLSKFDTQNVINMRFMFFLCTSLQEVDLSNFDTGKVTDMSAMFAGCSALKTIYCAEDADWSGVSSSNTMFQICSNLSGKYGSKEFPFDSNEIGGTYAKVYDGTNGGYFTYKGNRSYTLEVGEAGMATLYLDFDAVIPENVEVYCCEGLKDDEALPEAYAVKITQDVIPANTGVFVKAEPGKYLFNAFIPVETDGVTQVLQIYPDNILTGTLEDMEVGSHEVLTLGYSNQTNELGFWWFTGKTPIPANRAYIPGDKLTEGGVKGIRIVFDEETGIATTNLTNQTNEADAWYTIDGRKLDKKPQQRGLYINNGKKIIIK